MHVSHKSLSRILSRTMDLLINKTISFVPNTTEVYTTKVYIIYLIKSLYIELLLQKFIFLRFLFRGHVFIDTNKLLSYLVGMGPLMCSYLTPCLE